MNILYLTMPLNGLLMIALPVALGIYLTHRFKLSWRLFWIGALTFVLSQVGHIPFNSKLLAPFLEKALADAPSGVPYFTLIAIAYGLSAGVFEECARWLVYRFWIKNDHTWRRGLLFGAGHGGIEAIILGVLVLYTFINMLAVKGQDLSKLVPADQLELATLQVQTYWSTKWYDALLGAVERAFAIPLHLACSILVLQSFLRRRPHWLGLAILWHALADAAAVFFIQFWQQYAWKNYAVEGVLGLFALASVALIFTMRSPEPEPDVQPLAELPPVEPIPIKPLEETVENLEKSKYN